MDILNETNKTQFIPNEVMSFVKENEIFTNDAFIKYSATAEIRGELIVCNNITKLKPPKLKKMVKETYKQYLTFIEKRDLEKDRWIYNIIDGKKEQELILYADDKCIVIPTYIWDSKNIDKLHILCLPTDKTLRCIRSLTNEHIELLEHMKNKTINVIKRVYNLDETQIKILFHYEPSTYHLHLHFINVNTVYLNSSVELSHEFNNVLFNLSICPNYYQQIVLYKII
jgi:m7GpppX diphosphatase